MESVIKLKKRNVIIGTFLLTAIVLSSFVFANSFLNTKNSETSMSEAMVGNVKANPIAVFTCPAQSGTCTNGDWRCVEGLGGGTRACEYECASGTWGAGEECGGNACYGDRCN